MANSLAEMLSWQKDGVKASHKVLAAYTDSEDVTIVKHLAAFYAERFYNQRLLLISEEWIPLISESLLHIHYSILEQFFMRWWSMCVVGVNLRVYSHTDSVDFMEVSSYFGTPKVSILIGLSFLKHATTGVSPISETSVPGILFAVWHPPC